MTKDKRWQDTEQQQALQDERDRLQRERQGWQKRFLRPVQMLRDMRPLYFNKQPGNYHRKGRID